MKRNQAYVLLVGLLIVVLFLAGLYWSTLHNRKSQSIYIEDATTIINDEATEAAPSLSPIAVTTTTPIEVSKGNLYPTSVNTFAVIKVENFDNHLTLKLSYLTSDNKTKSVIVAVYDLVNLYDLNGESNQIAPAELYQYISTGDRISLDFFSNSKTLPVNEEDQKIFFTKSGLTENTSTFETLLPTDALQLKSQLDAGNVEIDHSEFRIVTIRKVAL